MSSNLHSGEEILRPRKTVRSRTNARSKTPSVFVILRDLAIKALACVQKDLAVISIVGIVSIALVLCFFAFLFAAHR